MHGFVVFLGYLLCMSSPVNIIPSIVLDVYIILQIVLMYLWLNSVGNNQIMFCVLCKDSCLACVIVSCNYG